MAKIEKIYKYPAHDIDPIAVTTERGLKILEKICKNHGTETGNHYTLIDGVRDTNKYQEWLYENIELLKTLLDKYEESWVDRKPDCYTAPMMEMDHADYEMVKKVITEELGEHIAVNDMFDILQPGVYLCTVGDTYKWEREAVKAIWDWENDIEVEEIGYGSTIHSYWLSFIGD